MKCVNTNSREYQTLKKQSGIPDYKLSYQVGEFLDKLGRYPHLDELDGADSEPSIKESLKINDKNITKVGNILEATNSDSIDDAVVKLNDKYRDKEIEINVISDLGQVFITPKPSINPKSVGEANINEVNSFQYYNDILDKMQTLYGIKIIPITNYELSLPEWKEIVGINQTKAFIYNGNIYVNTDIATVDSPIHELLHILFGSMKSFNKEMYEQIISISPELVSYNEISELYPNRTQSDVNEEVFITELAYYLTGRKNALKNVSDKALGEIFYNINRTLDIMLMGDASVKCIDQDQLYQMNLKTIANLVNSSTMNQSFQGSLQDSMINRIMSNKKSELMSKGLLREDCK